MRWDETCCACHHRWYHRSVCFIFFLSFHFISFHFISFHFVFILFVSLAKMAWHAQLVGMVRFRICVLHACVHGCISVGAVPCIPTVLTYVRQLIRLACLPSLLLFLLFLLADGAEAKRARLAPLRVGGVPEHFNLPFHLAQEQGLFAKHGVEVEFINESKGTGAMLASLKVY